MHTRMALFIETMLFDIAVTYHALLRSFPVANNRLLTCDHFGSINTIRPNVLFDLHSIACKVAHSPVDIASHQKTKLLA